MKPTVLSLKRLAPRWHEALLYRDMTERFPMGDVTVMHVSLQANKKLPLVCHRKTGELVFCLSGPVTAVLGRARRRLKKGEIVWIPPGVWHTFETGRRPIEALVVFHPRLDPDAPDVVRR